MSTIDPSLDQPAATCQPVRFCSASGCGCASPTDTDTGAGTEQQAPTRRGLKAALLAVACAAACLAGPLLIGGAAVVSGGLAGEWWPVAGLVVTALVVGFAVTRRRSGGKVC